MAKGIADLKRSQRFAPIRSGKPWQDAAPFAPAVRVESGPIIVVSGQVARNASGDVDASQGMRAQARQAFANMRDVLAAAGTSMRGIVKLTYFVTDMSRWAEVAEARKEFFSDYLPASTTVQVTRLFDTNAMIEIEAIAVPDDD